MELEVVPVSDVDRMRRVIRASDTAAGRIQKFAYSFDHCAEIMNHITQALGLSRYTAHMQEYGGPVGS
jgi:hypothetical protein